MTKPRICKTHGKLKPKDIYVYHGDLYPRRKCRLCNREKGEIYRKLHPGRANLAAKKNTQVDRAILGDSYMRQLIRKRYGIAVSKITAKQISDYRVQLLIKRKKRAATTKK